MMAYAQNTTVSVDKSRAEIERILQRYGATEFAYGWQSDSAAVMFTIGGRRVRFLLPMPDPTDFRTTPTGRRRSAEVQQQEVEQEKQRLWRALALAIKAKLEIVASGITTLEEEFMSHTMLPDGSTIADVIGPQIAESYRTGQMPSLLPGARLAIER